MKVFFQRIMFCLFGAVLLCSPVSSEVVERVVAVVGDKAILYTELVNQVQMIMMQADPNADMDPDELANQILEQMINDELILSAARDDTSTTASPEEIKYDLDEYIASLMSRFPSEEAFIGQLSREGLTKRALEKRLRPEIRDKILKRKIINNKLMQTKLSRPEVEEFFISFGDSLPNMPEKLRLAHILIKLKPSPATDDSLRSAAEKARQLAISGVDFSAVVDSLAPIAPGVVGGRIGFIRRNEVVAEFGRAAFALQPGNISVPIRTEYGWHVIKNHNRLADSIDVSQILFPALPSVADTIRATHLADSLYNELLNGANFKELAKLHSEDDSSRATGGELESMTMDQLRPEFAAPLGNIDEGEISQPVKSQLGLHLLKLLEKSSSRSLSLDEDFDIIRNIALREKTAQIVEEWVEELKKKIYVDIREFSLKQ